MRMRTADCVHMNPLPCYRILNPSSLGRRFSSIVIELNRSRGTFSSIAIELKVDGKCALRHTFLFRLRPDKTDKAGYSGGYVECLTFELEYNKTYKMTRPPSKDSYQPAHPRLRCTLEETLRPWLPKACQTKTLIRRGCAG